MALKKCFRNSFLFNHKIYKRKIRRKGRRKKEYGCGNLIVDAQAHILFSKASNPLQKFPNLSFSQLLLLSFSLQNPNRSPRLSLSAPFLFLSSSLFCSSSRVRKWGRASPLRLRPLHHRRRQRRR